MGFFCKHIVDVQLCALFVNMCEMIEDEISLNHASFAHVGLIVHLIVPAIKLYCLFIIVSCCAFHYICQTSLLINLTSLCKNYLMKNNYCKPE